MKLSHPKQLAIDISERSICRVKVGACIADKHGIYSWGWNTLGNGFGCCAETHALLRANRKRLAGSKIYVAGYHKKTKNPCPAKPCQNCTRLITAAGIKQVYWHGKEGWDSYYV